MKKKSPIIIKPNPGIKVNLKVEFINQKEVLAHLIFINTTDNPYALYKPLIGHPGTQELIFGISDEDEENPLDYIGKHIENYDQGKPGPLIVLHPKEGEDYYIVLQKDSIYETTINLVESFNFKKAKTHLVAYYQVFLPFVSLNDFKHILEEDPKDNAKLKPVYFNVNSGDPTQFVLQ